MSKHKIDKWIREACEDNGVPKLAKKIDWNWNNRLTAAAGRACTNYQIELSGSLWRRGSAEENEQTVKHEACHLIALHLYGMGEWGHGSGWKGTMRRAGLEPRRCHKINTTGLRKKPKRYTVHCGCTTRKFSGQKVAKMRRGERSYWCTRCEQQIKIK